jgi:phenylacetaldehyde dehydrogenase
MSLGTAWTKDLALAPLVAERARALFVGGEWVEPQGGGTIPVVDPATGREIARVARGMAADVDRAVAAARKAFESGPWPKMTGQARGKLLWKLADLIEMHRDEIALIETIDVGKPLAASRAVDAIGAAEKLRYVSGWASKINGETFDLTVPGDHHAYTLREPVGVAGLIVPWNFPFMMAISKLAEALAAGCTVVLKPAEQTSLATVRLGELVQLAGIPEGVVNIVTGYGPEAGQAMAEHPGIDKISFTGSTKVGKQILAACAGNLKRLSLELGGKSPAFVFSDADFDLAVQGVFRNIFYNTGQVCAAGSRVYAHKSVYDKLVAELSSRAKALRMGPGIDLQTELGPVVSQQQLDRVLGYVASGIAEGATVVTGGKRHGSQGFMVEPTILADTTAQMKVRREEIFGPVLCVTPFDDNDLDALAVEANDTEYGLSAFVYTRDLSTAHRMARKIKAGIVRINGAGVNPAAPFGGYKQSGWGRVSGREGVLAYTEQKSVIMAL